MSSRVTNQMLTRQIHHLTQHLPKKEELSGILSGSSYYRKINDDTFCKAFKRSHQQLDGLKDKYELTHEQMSFVSDAQRHLITEIKDAYAEEDEMPANIQAFVSRCEKTNGQG